MELRFVKKKITIGGDNHNGVVTPIVKEVKVLQFRNVKTTLVFEDDAICGGLIEVVYSEWQDVPLVEDEQ